MFYFGLERFFLLTVVKSSQVKFIVFIHLAFVSKTPGAKTKTKPITLGYSQTIGNANSKNEYQVLLVLCQTIELTGT